MSLPEAPPAQQCYWQTCMWEVDTFLCNRHWTQAAAFKEAAADAGKAAAFRAQDEVQAMQAMGMKG